jgi:chaperone required for assembly of F1-ATPase
MATQQMRVVLCTNQRQKVSGASATAVPALPWVLPWLEKAGEVFGAIILGIFFYEGIKKEQDKRDEQQEKIDEAEKAKEAGEPRENHKVVRNKKIYHQMVIRILQRIC